jgi:hypothetical protein
MNYIFFFSIFALLSLINDKIRDVRYLNLFLFLSLILFSGARWDVAGDWASYTSYFDNIYTKNSSKFTLFYAINLFSNFLNLEVLGKNIVLITIFLFPFYYVFKKYYENFYLSLCILFPIIFIVYGMGSIRQGLAIAYFFLFFHYSGNRIIKIFLFIVPIFFHPTAIIIQFFYIFSIIFNFDNYKTLFIRLIIFIFAVLISIYFGYDYIEAKVRNYIIIDTYKSSGAFVRAFLLSIFCVIFLVYFKKIKLEKKDIKNFLLFGSIFVLILSPFTIFFTTSIDRILAYFLILKLSISNEIIKNIDDKVLKNFVTIFFILICFGYLVLWIFMGNKSHYWFNYQFAF